MDNVAIVLDVLGREIKRLQDSLTCSEYRESSYQETINRLEAENDVLNKKLKAVHDYTKKMEA